MLLSLFVALLYSDLVSRSSRAPRSFKYESFSANKVIFRQHSSGDKFYLIMEGSCSISIFMEQSDGSHISKEVHVCKAGDYFGERALQYDEPRAATVTSIDLMECLSLSKEVYSEILKNVNNGEVGNTRDKASAAARRVLAKKRDQRTQEELMLVVSYLDRRVDFFRKFDRAQQIALARVAELLVVRQGAILFKQGQIGQAFYIILSGKVHIHVDSPNEEGTTILVNTLGHGTAFGERALESASSIRNASVSIAETSELLLISRNDYRLVRTRLSSTTALLLIVIITLACKSFLPVFVLS